LESPRYRLGHYKQDRKPKGCESERDQPFSHGLTFAMTRTVLGALRRAKGVVVDRAVMPHHGSAVG
jgi:hypothetical protein